MKNIDHAITGICGIQNKEKDYQRTAKQAYFLLAKRCHKQ